VHNFVSYTKTFKKVAYYRNVARMDFGIKNVMKYISKESVGNAILVETQKYVLAECA